VWLTLTSARRMAGHACFRGCKCKRPTAAGSLAHAPSTLPRGPCYAPSVRRSPTAVTINLSLLTSWLPLPLRMSQSDLSE
jgi:hypothetical protein